MAKEMFDNLDNLADQLMGTEPFSVNLRDRAAKGLTRIANADLELAEELIIKALDEPDSREAVLEYMDRLALTLMVPNWQSFIDQFKIEVDVYHLLAFICLKLFNHPGPKLGSLEVIYLDLVRSQAGLILRDRNQFGNKATETLERLAINLSSGYKQSKNMEQP